ncbi:MAG: hypothetical protein Q7R76_00415 [Candidatus Woesearchaeota archaeon]|nr:hypothetical protein [Candidatus Woesearchaeota archaeon]
MVIAVPTLDEIITYYKTKEPLLAHEEVVRDMAAKIRPLTSEIPEEELKRNIALLTVWPLVEIYRLAQRAITHDLKKNEQENFTRLMDKYHQLVLRGEQNAVLSYSERPEQPKMHFVQPYNFSVPAFGALLTRMSEPCDTWHDHLRDTTRSHMKALHDAQMGGSLFVIEKEKQRDAMPFTLYQRSFICINQNGEPVLFMDGIQHQEGPDVSRLNHWRGYDKNSGEKVRESSIHEVYASVASALYLAQKLDIRYIVLRDTPLVDFARENGIPERKVFSEDDMPWKIGLHSLEQKTGVHTNLLYGSGKDRRTGVQLRCQTLEQFPYQNPAEMFQKLEALAAEVISTNRDRKKRAPKTTERLQAAAALYNLIVDFPLTPSTRRQQAYEALKASYGAVHEMLSITPPTV